MQRQKGLPEHTFRQALIAVRTEIALAMAVPYMVTVTRPRLAWRHAGQAGKIYWV